MAWLLEVVLTINEVKQGRAVLVLLWVTTRESMALAWKTRGFKPTLHATCCTVASNLTINISQDFFISLLYKKFKLNIKAGHSPTPHLVIQQFVVMEPLNTG